MGLKNIKQARVKYQSVDDKCFDYVTNFVQKIKDGAYGCIDEDDINRQLSNNFNVPIDSSMKQLAIYLLKINDLIQDYKQQD